MTGKWIKEPVQADIPDLDKEAFDKVFNEWEDKYFELLKKIGKTEEETHIAPVDDSTEETSEKEIFGYRTAAGSFKGSEEYTPSTLVALITASQSNSSARKAAVVSVVKNGFPVPPEQITTFPCFKSLTAFSALNFSTIPSMATEE